jgi:hypothetical protein
MCSSTSTSIAAVALGTKGDVQPVALVAYQLAQQLHSRSSSSSPGSVTLITHAAHTSWLEQQQLAGSAADAQVQLLCTSSLPAGVWHGESNSKASSLEDSRGAEVCVSALRPVGPHLSFRLCHDKQLSTHYVPPACSQTGWSRSASQPGGQGTQSVTALDFEPTCSPFSPCRPQQRQ